MKVGEVWKGIRNDNTDSFCLIIDISYQEIIIDNFIKYIFIGSPNPIFHMGRKEFTQWFSKYADNMEEFLLIHPEFDLMRIL